jgi:predicted metal-dependent peptidase
LQEYLENERRAREQQLNEEWKQLSKEIQSELENFGKDHGDESQYLVQLLEHLNRERYDYGAFLKRFAVSGEVMRADLDAFEPGFYSYGLSLYGNVALIEPPEYKETHLVRDFVIAIDTSGSVRGDLVQTFMQKTYNILKSTESFFTRVNIFIIQCDTEVREAVQITCQADLDRYIAKMELKGLGGTDFRPVFDYIDDLRGKGVLTGLKGMVYFTDGKGIFPERKPPYDAAFAFIGETPESVPAWAVKLTLEREDIMDER